LHTDYFCLARRRAISVEL